MQNAFAKDVAIAARQHGAREPDKCRDGQSGGLFGPILWRQPDTRARCETSFLHYPSETSMKTPVNQPRGCRQLALLLGLGFMIPVHATAQGTVNFNNKVAGSV